ncbi:MAG: hypothetical protein AAFU49_24555, partial [Pseudomonadota bacterium]
MDCGELTDLTRFQIDPGGAVFHERISEAQGALEECVGQDKLVVGGFDAGDSKMISGGALGQLGPRRFGGSSHFAALTSRSDGRGASSQSSAGRARSVGL